MTRRGGPNARANAAVLALSLGLCLLAAEALLRQIRPLGADSALQHRIPHPVLGWVLEPGARYLHPTSGGVAHVRYNAGGWRDVERDPAHPSAAFRILVLGDSFMEAYSVELADAFARQLEHMARARGLDVEVVNLGVGGYGTLQEYLLFRHIGRRYHPDLVLVGMYLGNDVRNNSLVLESIVNAHSIKGRSRPFLDPAHQWKITQVDYAGSRRRYERARAAERALFNRLARRSALLTALRDAAGELRRSLGGKAVADSMRYLAMQGVHYCREPAEYAEAWRITRAILRRLRDEVRDAGARLLVFTVPAQREVDEETMRKVLARAPAPHLLCLEEAPGYRRLRRLLGQLGIAQVDLLPAFRRAARAGGAELFHASDRHWNQAGHRLAAERVLDALVQKGLLPAPSTR